MSEDEARKSIRAAADALYSKRYAVSQAYLEFARRVFHKRERPVWWKVGYAHPRDLEAMRARPEIRRRGAMLVQPDVNVPRGQMYLVRAGTYYRVGANVAWFSDGRWRMYGR